MYTKPVFFRTAADITQHIKVGETTESIVLDFKREFNKEEAAHEFAADICAFANKWGGAILFGINEGRNDSNFKVASGLPGVENAEVIRQRFNTAIRDCLYPQTMNFDIAIIPRGNENPIVSINIQAHADGVCCARDKKYGDWHAFPIRTEHGKEYMTMDTVEKNYSSNTRRIMLRMQELCGKVRREAEIISPVKEEVITTAMITNAMLHEGIPPGQIQRSIRNWQINAYIENPGEYDFDLYIKSNCRKIPYGLVAEVWETAFNKVGLFLKVSIFSDPNGGFQLKA